MSAWFKTTQMEAGVIRFTEPLVHDFFRANLYRISGRDFDIHLDFGIGVADLTTVSLATGHPVLAIASHAHVDHVGCFHRYARRAGHALEADIFADMRDEGTLASWFKKIDGAVANQPQPDWSLANYTLTPAPLTEILAEGDRIDLGNRQFTILHLPGHSPGSIGLLDEHDGTFFAADAIYQGGLVDDIPGANIEAYLKTMQRLAELDVRIVHAGHGESFDQARMREIALGYIKGRCP